MSINSPIVIVTQNAVFGSPEAKIVFFTDCSAGLFLSRLRNNIGPYLGLTSSFLKGQDIVKSGLAKYFIESKYLEEFKKELSEFLNCKSYGLSEKEISLRIHQIVEKYTRKCEGSIPYESLIKKIFGNSTVEDIYKALEEETEAKEFIDKTLSQLNANSPLSLKVIKEQIKQHKNISLKEAFKADFKIAYHFMNGIDFYEGVRCLLIDRGDKPKWEFNNLSLVSDEEVLKYFKNINSDEELDI